MTPNDIMLIAKVFACAMGDRSMSLSQADKEYASELLKRLADNRSDWTDHQKIEYKMLVEMVSKDFER